MLETGSTSGFSDAFASFAFYDTNAAENRSDPEKARYLRLDDALNQPILWKHVHRSVAQVLRTDPDLKTPNYAGFATLFTLNQEADGNAPRYPSMTIDVKLDSPGFRDLILSKTQFIKRTTIPLTAVCLKTAGDDAFKTAPIIFHWTRPGRVDSDCDAPKVEELSSWGHVYVNAKIHYDDKTGIEVDLNKTNFGVEDSELIRVGDNLIANGTVRFNEREFYRRLRNHVGNGEIPETLLARKIAWTVTYFAYACELYLQQRLDCLSIVCAPASFDEEVSSALYVPIHCTPSNPEFSRLALKILYLARSLASPLWKIHDLYAARKEGQHEATSAILHQIPKDFGALDECLSRLRQLADSDDATVAKMRSLIPDTDAMAVLLMESDAAARRDSYQLLPAEFPEALVREGCSVSLVKNIFQRLVIPYVNQRVLVLDDIERCPECDPFDYKPEEFVSMFPPPRIEPFGTFYIPDARDAYIWLLLVLRSAANHAYRPTVARPKKEQGSINIRYTMTTKTLSISNTGTQPVLPVRRQNGWLRDIEVFRRGGQRWKVVEREQGIFSTWSEDDQRWTTKLQHLG